jgi:hypothetical protein
VLIEEGVPQPFEVARDGKFILFAGAGIKLTTLKPHTSYTAPQLAQMPGSAMTSDCHCLLPTRRLPSLRWS